MKIISKPKYFKVKCYRCASVIMFNYYEINQDYNPKNYSITCPECNFKIPVGIADCNNEFNLLNHVETIYEE